MAAGQNRRRQDDVDCSSPFMGQSVGACRASSTGLSRRWRRSRRRGWPRLAAARSESILDEAATLAGAAGVNSFSYTDRALDLVPVRVPVKHSLVDKLGWLAGFEP